ncbi:class I SAM-dependent methyltransferase [Actinophytocola xinjiangensis]|uniref:class I SAM-dependent methyltransferase n=1 Tax=Actinophytocola xinjiangensis TaxID=485602 RepID=UPI000ADE16B4|nr:methyltransferase domain-containing protein [Actinophytocola xinjiangensis]
MRPHTEQVQRTIPQPRHRIPGPAEIVEEWRRRSARPGLTSVMRASQPVELAAGVTEETRRLVGDHLRATSSLLGRPVSSAVEIGCGIGRITPTIAKHAEHVLALDLTEEMIAQARAACVDLPNVEFLQRPAQRLPIGGQRVDVAVCVWVLMHVLDDALLAAACQGIARSARYLSLVEYEHAAVPVGPFSRLRSIGQYLALLPGSELVECRELGYGGDRSFAALIALDRS